MAGKCTADLRIILLGKTGSGKSAAGNTILGREAFKERTSLESVTMTCEKQEVVMSGKTVSVIDCPGLFDTSVSNKALHILIERCIEPSAPDPPVPLLFLLVVRLGVKFTEEEKNTVKWIEQNFGEESLKYTIILFTHADALKGTPLEEYIGKSTELQELIKTCYGRCHSFNNNNKENRNQVTELLKLIEKMINFNGKQTYTADMYKAAQEKIKREQKLRDAGKKGLTAAAAAAAVIGAAGVVAAGGRGAIAAAAAAAVLGVVGAAAAAVTKSYFNE